MSKLRLLIVDDEPLIRKGVRNAASSLADAEIIGECGSGREAIEVISSQKPDLVLLDVQMPDCSGLDVIRQIGAEQMPPVIFITAYDEYAVKAFELNAVDYLLKPFDDSRFRESVERARQRITGNNQAALAQQLNALLDSQAQKWPERLVIRNGERFDFVPVETIDWIESANNYVELHCGSRQYLMGETMTNLEHRLDPSRFVRIHRCRIVNTSRIVAVHPLLGSTYGIELRGGIRLSSGRQYKDVVQRLIHC
jgi:two-component system LytT family response regulator